MADELPEPKSRKESYLAKAAGMDVTIPEKPESRLEQYLDAIAEGGGGGGGTYTAGDGIDITNDTISVDTNTIQEKLTAGTGIDITDNTISATGGGGGPTVVQTTGTSTTDVMSQDATTKMISSSLTDNSVNILSSADHGTNSVSIGNNSTTYQPGAIAIGGGNSSTSGANAGGVYSVAIGSSTYARSADSIAIGREASAREECTAIGHQAGKGGSTVAKENVYVGHQAGSVTHSNTNSVALGHYSQITRTGEVSVGSNSGTSGYNNTGYRVIGNVYDGQDAHDAATYGQLNTRLDGLTLLKISQTDYDNLQSYDANTLYVITGA